MTQVTALVECLFAQVHRLHLAAEPGGGWPAANPWGGGDSDEEGTDALSRSSSQSGLPSPRGEAVTLLEVVQQGFLLSGAVLMVRRGGGAGRSVIPWLSIACLQDWKGQHSTFIIATSQMT